MDVRLKEQPHFERAFPQALILMPRPCSLSRSNSSAHHRIIHTALLPEFGGMGIGAVRQAHNLKIIGSNPIPATRQSP